MGIILNRCYLAASEKILGIAYAEQSGTRSGGTTITHIDKSDYWTYSSVNFGTSGTTKGILMNYSKSTNGGASAIEVRLGRSGDETGPVIAEFNPASTRSWSDYQTAYIGIKDVTGVHDVTFVAKDGVGVFNLAWIELSDFPERSKVHAHVAASAYSNQKGIMFSGGKVGWFDNNDYITYSSLNFGELGTTYSMKINYAKSGTGGKVEIRLDGPDGKIIGEYKPANTGSWGNYVDVNVAIDGVEGIHDITFVGRDRKSGIWNMGWFELSEMILFKVTSNYRVDDNKANARDVQCTYDVVRESFVEQVYDRYFTDGGSTVDATFFDHLGADDEVDAKEIASSLCASAQNGIKEQ